MVVIEEVTEEPRIEEVADGAVVAKKETVKKGFLNNRSDDQALYGPEGSAQGKVTQEQKDTWLEKARAKHPILCQEGAIQSRKAANF